ncbi:SDR family NAD(P)-dependent oxidoreductase [Candidatus Pelagibacter sp.]|nr:SDR family NAD(P)-dependent oxidoreductase [Candidatus Pelagibacter sp.]
MSNILVTGGSGFIGSHIVETLKEANHKVFNIDRTNSNFADVYQDIDINDSASVEKFLKENKIEYVYHIAAIANARRSLENVQETMINNVAGTASILNACANANIKKVILASTVWVYNAADKNNSKKENGNILLDEESNILPTCGGHFYTTSKLCSEFLCQDFKSLKNLNFTILRYGIPYGPRMWPGLVLRAFTENALSNKPIVINGDGSAKRRFINVKDLAQGHLLALDSKADNQIYNLEGDKDITIKELADLVSLNIKDVKVEYIIDETRAGELKTDSIEISNQKMKKDLGWEINVSIEEGVKSYIEWFKKNN